MKRWGAVVVGLAVLAASLTGCRGAESAEATRDSKIGLGAEPLTSARLRQLAARYAVQEVRLSPGGFTVGTHGMVNRSSDTYSWVAFKAAAGALKVGSYTGNGGRKSITGLGFSPEYVLTCAESASNMTCVHRTKAMTASYGTAWPVTFSTGITSLDSDGFSVGGPMSSAPARIRCRSILMPSRPWPRLVSTLQVNIRSRWIRSTFLDWIWW